MSSNWPIARVMLVLVAVVGTAHAALGVSVLYWAAMTPWTFGPEWHPRLFVCAFGACVAPLWGLAGRHNW